MYCTSILRIRAFSPPELYSQGWGEESRAPQDPLPLATPLWTRWNKRDKVWGSANSIFKWRFRSRRRLRLRVVPYFFSGVVERVKRERAWKSPHARKGNKRVVFSRVGWFSLALAFRLHAPLSLRKNGGLLVRPVYTARLETSTGSRRNLLFTRTNSVMFPTEKGTVLESSSVAADPKVSPNWSLKTMTCHSSHCFSISWG